VHGLLPIDINDSGVIRNDKKYPCIYKSTQYDEEVFRKHAAYSNIVSCTNAAKQATGSRLLVNSVVEC